MTTNETARERELAQAFVQLADTLVSEFDVADLLHSLVEHCVDLLGVDAAGIMLTDERGSLQVMAASSEHLRLLELFQWQADEGPCLEAFHSGEPVSEPDLSGASDRWPTFAPGAQEAGFAAVQAVPMRLRAEAVGALNLFSTTPGDIHERDMTAAQALADVATIGILSERAIAHQEMVVEQLQGALNSRVVIEQAKGMIAESEGLEMDTAFERLRQAARSSSTRLSDLARDVVEGRLDTAHLAGSATRSRRPR